MAGCGGFPLSSHQTAVLGGGSQEETEAAVEDISLKAVAGDVVQKAVFWSSVGGKGI